MTRPAPAPSRIVIDEVTPLVEGGRLPVKRVVGEPVVVEATVLADGHDRLLVVVSHRPPGSARWVEVDMAATNPGLDRWAAAFTPEVPGRHPFRIRAWVDQLSTWRDATRRKVDAGLDIGSECLSGAGLLDELAASARKPDAPALRAAAGVLRDGDVSLVTDEQPWEVVAPHAHAALARGDATTSTRWEVDVERERALFSSWYELFPRSVTPRGTDPADRSDDAAGHGTLRDVEDRLEELADLGVDVLYLPPIHPIGRAFRKGPDNTETATDGDPGSPWAIGGPEGGHTAVHADLGTVDDLAHLAAAAGALDIDLALDLAFQCSPDHPWVTEHPEWFAHRPDGTIQYAENPPKIYQDIYPLDFASADWRALWDALEGVTRFWLDRGVRVFRVDNPHTKPFAFWEWLIARVRATHPDTIFLAEAFTRPAVMRRLAQIGFTQGYTYFTWRTSKQELVEYFTELSTPPWVDEFRPNAWPTTPDILPGHLQGAPLEAFALRLLLAATLSPSFGVFGPSFELGENEPVGDGREELARSEKYEVRRWDLSRARTLRPMLAALNRIRRDQLALHTLRTLRFHPVGNDVMVCFSKTTHRGPSTDPNQPGAASVLVVVNLDPDRTQAAMVDLDLAALGVDGGRPYLVEDLLGGRAYVWQGGQAYVELHPDQQPGHVFRVTQQPDDIEPAPSEVL